jgi:hypothetical protein
MNTLAKSRQERNTNAGAGFLTSTYFSGFYPEKIFPKPHNRAYIHYRFYFCKINLSLRRIRILRFGKYWLGSQH